MSAERSLKDAGAARGPIKIIKAKDLSEAGTTGTIISGTYEGVQKNPAGVSASGKKYPASTEYKVRGEGDTLYILKDCKALRDQFGQLAEDGSDNANVRVEYNGKVTTKSGGDYHDFVVYVTNT